MKNKYFSVFLKENKGTAGNFEVVSVPAVQ